VSPTTPVFVQSASAIQQQALEAGAKRFFSSDNLGALAQHLKDHYAVT